MLVYVLKNVEIDTALPAVIITSPVRRVAVRAK
jgi:hypothetical protein